MFSDDAQRAQQLIAAASTFQEQFEAAGPSPVAGTTDGSEVTATLNRLERKIDTIGGMVLEILAGRA